MQAKSGRQPEISFFLNVEAGKTYSFYADLHVEGTASGQPYVIMMTNPRVGADDALLEAVKGNFDTSAAAFRKADAAHPAQLSLCHGLQRRADCAGGIRPSGPGHFGPAA